jgi:SnoaL-like domain
MHATELVDRLLIAATIAQYTMAGDRGLLDQLAATFTEDGILETDIFTLTGRESIVEGLKSQGRASVPADSSPLFVRHHVTAPHIQFEGEDCAKSRCYFTVYSNNGLDHCGVYSDLFSKVGETWLIAHRKARLDWQAPTSIFPKVEKAPRR